MPVGVYQRQPKTLKTRKKTRTSDFFKTEKGKKWYEYDGNLQDNEDFVYEQNQYYYVKKRKEKDPNYKPGRRKGPRCPHHRGGPKKLDEKTRKERYDLRIAHQQEKIWCSCGKQIRRGYMTVHRQTKKHLVEEREQLDALPPPPQEWLDEIEKMDMPIKTRMWKPKKKKIVD